MIMLDPELIQLQTWRYCNVTNGDKKPYPNNWQNTPLTLQQVQSDNIGVILGKHSNGLCAIDFDGIEAIDHWTNTFGIDITDMDTVMWSSGKDYRCQAAFTIDNEYWDVLKRKVVNKLEFRWNCQSVLPPSKLNDGREYFWLKKPSETVVQRLPETVLSYWLELIYDDMTKYDQLPTVNYEISTYDSEFIDVLLGKISSKVGNLHGDYDVWRTIAWAVCSQVGIMNAKYLMNKHWPTKTKKEIKTLNAYKSGGRSPGIGTLIKLSGISKMEKRLLELKYKVGGNK
jgi:hypothetical protein